MLGPDGAGKSTLIHGLQAELLCAFRRTATYHLMPGLLRRRGDDGPVTDPHGKPPRSLLPSLLKLLYYWVDYTLGYWLKVRPALVRSTLVLFDRYYDDLLVDPKRYRYGGPLWLARWLRRFIPHPDVFLVLDVPAEKLLERKQEVPPEEVERQVEDYRRFALSTPNAFLLDAGQTPNEVVRRARDVLLDVLHERCLRRRRIWFQEAREDHLAWLGVALDVEIGFSPATHAYLRLPDGRGFLLPLDNSHVFRRGLEIYPAQGRKGRLARTLLTSLAGVGLKGAGLRKVRLGAKREAVFHKLNELFNRDVLSFAVSLGTPGPHRKPVVQVMTRDGEVLAYAKVGWNEATTKLVKRESEVLRSFDGKDLPFKVPAVLYDNHDRGRALCIQTPPPEGAKPPARSLSEEYIRVLCALAEKGLRREPLEKTAFWQRIVERSLKVQNAYWRGVLTEAMERAKKLWRGREVPGHFAHGDFTPWNALSGQGTLYLYDWEYAQEWAPAGYDLFHFLVQMGWLIAGKGAKEIVESVLRQGHSSEMKGYWRRTEVSLAEIPELLYLLLFERFSFHCDSMPKDFKRLKMLSHLLLVAQSTAS